MTIRARWHEVELYAGTLYQKWEVPGASAIWQSAARFLLARLGAQRRSRSAAVADGRATDENKPGAKKYKASQNSIGAGARAPFVFVEWTRV